jgi:hypothetical protein
MSGKRLSVRLFNILIAVTLVVMGLLTAQQVSGVTLVARAETRVSVNPATPPSECLRLALHQSLTTVYNRDLNMFLPVTDQGYPTGVDGGLIYLLSLPRCQ